METEKVVEQFLAFVLAENNAPIELGDLMLQLDRLACAVGQIEFEFDETEYPDAPERNYAEIRSIVETNFPTVGYYNTPEKICEDISVTRLNVGDGIGDIADIVGDLEEASWRFKHTSEADALWCLQQSFRSHWGRHLRELQLYLHDQWW